MQVLCGPSLDSRSWVKKWMTAFKIQYFRELYSSWKTRVEASVARWLDPSPLQPSTGTSEALTAHCSTGLVRIACTAATPTTAPTLRTTQINPSTTSLISHNFQLGEIIKLTLMLTRKWAHTIYSLYSLCISYCCLWDGKKTQSCWREQLLKVIMKNFAVESAC